MYMNTITKKCKIVIEPQELSDINNHIYRKLESFVGDCTKKDGYIISIDTDFKIISNIISRVSGNCIYYIFFKIQTLKPEDGHTYGALVNRIYPQGLFCEYHNIKIIIPSESMDGWEFENSIYINKSTDKSISKGDWINVLINVTRYDNRSYQCIGSLLDN